MPTKKKQKTLPTDLTDFSDSQQPKPKPCPQCSSSKNVVKAGTRKLKSTSTQVYLCKACNHRFTNRTIPHTQYPTTLILRSLTYFNLGHTLQQTQATMQCKYKSKIPISTLNNWIKRFEPEFECSIILVEDPQKGVSGPIWVRGGIPIESSSGTIYEIRNRVTLCRCGRSENKPFCDYSHLGLDLEQDREKN